MNDRELEAFPELFPQLFFTSLESHSQSKGILITKFF